MTGLGMTELGMRKRRRGAWLALALVVSVAATLASTSCVRAQFGLREVPPKTDFFRFKAKYTGNPFLVVLDEPNSNLDSEGDEALAGAIKSVRARGGIVVIVAHRQNTLASVDLLLAMNSGRQIAFGPRDEILRKLIGKNPSGPGPLVIVNESTKA
jgi:hypothetical protein